jgi:hypothetical protein
MRIDQIELSGSLSISASLATNPLVVNEDYLFVSNTGNVGIGTNNPTSKLVVTGSVAVQGGLRATTASGSFTFNESSFSIDTTSGLKIPVGTTAQRPSSPSNGMIRLNTTLRSLEVYYNTADWIPFYSIPIYVDYLVVAGGGGGGWANAGYMSGGGGAGGLRSTVTATGGGGILELNSAVYKNVNYSINVGSGGAVGTSITNGSNGSNSVFSTITATGGGGGGFGRDISSGNGAVGGSGGGGGCQNTLAGSTAGSSGTTNEGYNGGSGRNRNGDTANMNAGGGGGAGSIGISGENNTIGHGGNGLLISIIGSTVAYAGGGGGGSADGTALGGSSVGGNGAYSSPGTTGAINKGGGGGGGQNSNTGNGGAAGGSGVVIIRYPNTESDLTLSTGIQYATSNGAVTTSITSDGVYAPSYTPTGYKVYEFRGTGGVPLNIKF